MTRPLHVQVEEEVTRRLRRLRPGDRLPTEPDLAAELGVSRATLRQALARIEDAGLIERRPGAGTVVTRPSLDQPLGGAVTLRQAATAAGIELDAELEGVDLLPAAEGPPELARTGHPLLWLRRVYTSAAESVAREELWLDDPDAGRLRQLIQDDPTLSIYVHLTLTNRRPQWSEEVLEADRATSRERELFGDEPVLRLRRVSGTDRPNEVRELALRSDQVHLSARWGVPPGAV